MTVIRDIKNLDMESAVAIGYFDGMHPGHRLIIEKTVKEKDKGLVPAVLTFDFSKKRPGEKSDRDLFPKEEKYQEMESLGIEICVECDFAMIANMSAEYFLHEILIGKMGCREIFCGEDFRFGHNRSADAVMLKNMAESEGVYSEAVPSLYLDDEIISTTVIKRFVKEGKVDEAARFLGRNYGINVKIIDLQNEKTIGVIESKLTFPKAGRYVSGIGRDSSPDSVSKIIVEDDAENSSVIVEIDGNKAAKINEKMFLTLFSCLGDF